MKPQCPARIADGIEFWRGWPSAAGGRFLARGNAAKAYESGVAQRVVVIEFDSVEQAVAAHDSAGYQAALKVFGKAADRDLRIVEGLA